MPTDFSSPNVKIFEENLALVDKKDRENKGLGGGLFSSWTTPIEELDPSLVPEDRRKMIVESQRREFERRAREKQAQAAVLPPALRPAVAPSANEALIIIPLPAMRKFKALIEKSFEMKVLLSREQASLLLADLRAMKTPKNMIDTKYIVKLIDSLEQFVGTNEPDLTA